MLPLRMARPWQKIRENHSLLIVLCCIVPIVVIIGFLSLFKNGGNWLWLLILLCPILHFWLMRDHKHDGNNKKDNDL